MSRATGRAVLIVAGVAIALAAIEKMARLRDAREAEAVRVVSGTDYHQRHDVLGFAPAPNSRATVVRTSGARTVYSVTYTIDGDGLRIGPPEPPAGASRCALFFGDSFTFGEGVADRETLPYVAGVLSGYRTYNFAFQGYGPHQMLAAIERGMVSRVVRCMPTAIVYQAVVDHPWRAAGRAPWDRHGPRFVLGADGVTYAGQFDDPPVPHRPLLARALNRSHAYRRLVGVRVTDDDIARFVAIVGTARDRLHAMYPPASFHMILWDAVPGNAVVRREAEALQRAGITPQLASRLLPGYAEDHLKYELDETDSHPNPAALRLVARFVAANFLGH